MTKINVGFIAENASLQRDEQGRLIVLASGVEESDFTGAPERYKAQVEVNRIAAEREAKIRAEAEKIVAAQEAEAQSNG